MRTSISSPIGRTGILWYRRTRLSVPVSHIRLVISNSALVRGTIAIDSRAELDSSNELIERSASEVISLSDCDKAKIRVVSSLQLLTRIGSDRITSGHQPVML